MILYLLKSTAILFVLYTFYKLFLERETMHVFKRFYLLFSILIAFIIPLLTYTQYVEPILFNYETTQPIRISTGDLYLDNIIPQYQYYSKILFSILWIIYGLGVVLFGLRFINNLLNIYSKIKHNTIVRSKQYSHVLLSDLLIPHTFLNYLFLNKQKYKVNLIPKEVLLHEQTHAQQKHTIDILYVELLQIVFWFHPLFYFIKKSIKLNHEFLADQAVLNKGVNKKLYQQTILTFSSNSIQPQLTNAFNYSLIKKRFTVMKTKTTKRSIWLRSMVILPLLAVLIYGFSEKVIVEKEYQFKENNEAINNLQKITKINQSIVNKKIYIKINSKKQILINEKKLVTLKIFGSEIKNIIANYSPEQLANTLAVIEAPDTIDMGFLIDVSEELRKVGVNFIRKYVAENNTFPEKKSQKKIEKASKEQIGEYNKIANKYNDMPQTNMIISKKEVGRLKYLYRIMSVKQRKNAEPYPVFPRTPPTFERSERTPPPSPLPDNPTFKQKEKYKNEVKKNKIQAPVIEYENNTKTEQVIEFVENPNFMELPEVNDTLSVDKKYEYETVNGKNYKIEYGLVSEENSLLAAVIKASKKGAVFYMEENKISSDKAIKLVKKNPYMSASITYLNTITPIVKLSDNITKSKK